MFGLPSTDEYVLGRGMTHFNVLGAAPTGREFAEWHNRLQELAAIHPPRHPRHDLDRPATLVHRQPRRRDHGRPVLRSGPSRSASPRSATRRSSSASATSPARSTRRSASASRCTRRSTSPPSRAGRAGRDLRRGPRADGRARRRVHPRLPGRRARPRLRRHDDQALPRRRPPEGRRGPAFRLRPRAGLPGRRSSSCT